MTHRNAYPLIPLYQRQSLNVDGRGRDLSWIVSLLLLSIALSGCMPLAHEPLPTPTPVPAAPTKFPGTIRVLVRLNVVGSAPRARVTYTNEKGEFIPEELAALPWGPVEFVAERGERVRLSAVNDGGNGSVRCRIAVSDEVRIEKEDERAVLCEVVLPRE